MNEYEYRGRKAYVRAASYGTFFISDSPDGITVKNSVRNSLMWGKTNTDPPRLNFRTYDGALKWLEDNSTHLIDVEGWNDHE